MAKKSKKKKFPDLTGDGKVTRADILKGRGVIESDDFIDEVMRRVEDKVLLEEELIQDIVSEAEDLGIDINDLTEAELDELFGFGLEKRSALQVARDRQAKRKAKPAGNEKSVLSDKVRGKDSKFQKGQRTRRIINSLKKETKPEPEEMTSQERSNFSKSPADKKKVTKPRSFAVGSEKMGTPKTQLATNRRGFGGNYRRAQANKFGAEVNEPVMDARPLAVRRPKKLGLAASTGIVRGARLALAERVLNAMSEELEPLPEPPKIKKSSAAERKAYADNLARKKLAAEKARVEGLQDSGFPYKSR